nr:D-alanyl-D-alanine carboxypeptidase/D-alanyl-D-alanine-endopeptidase [Brevibacterium daeguense]
MLVGYGTADALDAVPGILTFEAPIEVQPLPQPVARAVPADAAAPLPSDAPIPQSLGSRLQPVLDQDGMTGALGVDIRDAATGEVLYAVDEAAARTPASVTKVLTAAAALGAVGADTRFTTAARLSPTEGTTGTVHLVGGGDVLLGAGASDPDAVIGHAGLASLAEQTASGLRAAGVDTVTVAADLSRYPGPSFNAGWDQVDVANGYIAPIVPLMVNSALTSDAPGSARQDDPAGAAVAAFAAALEDRGIAAATADPGAAPADSALLGTVESAPVSAVVRHLLLASDNVVSEVMGREVALALDRPGSAAEAPAAVIAALAAQQLDTGSIELADTSGLDYANRISAHDLTTILQAAATSDGDLSLLLPSLPVGGLSGTLFDRYLDEDTDDAAGRVSAKTGSLRTVSSLAGSVLTQDGRLVVFSLLSDGLAPGSAGAARQVIDEAVTVIAECGC